MRSAYLETTIVSYYRSRLSGDLVTRGKQLLTRRFWLHALERYRIVISDVVIDEVTRGDADASQKRLEALVDFEVVQTDETALRLAEKYTDLLELPKKSWNDAIHLSLACLNGIDFLVTWNCAHIANVELIEKIIDHNSRKKLHTPLIVTPDFFFGRR